LVLKLYYTINLHKVGYAYAPNLAVPSGAPAPPSEASGIPYNTGMNVAANPALAGYDFSGWTPAAASGITVGADGAFTIPADNDVFFTGYWTARTDTPYTVEHYLVSANGVAVRALAESKKGTTGATVNAALMN
jgi:hypothetical protein